MQPKWVLLNDEVDKQWSGWQQGPEAQSRCLSQQCGGDDAEFSVMGQGCVEHSRFLWNKAGFCKFRFLHNHRGFCTTKLGSEEEGRVLCGIKAVSVYQYWNLFLQKPQEPSSEKLSGVL